MQAWVPTLLSVAVVSIVSLVGALALTLPGLRSHRFLLFMVAMAAGTLMGDAFFHLVPEASEAWEGKSLAGMGFFILAGFVAFFTLEVVLRARHAHAELAGDSDGHHQHDHDHNPAHVALVPGHNEHAAAQHVAAAGVAPYAWTNLVGDALHNLLDGAVIATAYLVDTGLGLATTIAVVVHEVPQELGDFAVLLRSGMRPARALMLNLGSALLSVLGAVVILLLPIDAGAVERYGLPLVTGAFIYIASADLIPELHHHSKGKEAVAILVSFLVGLALMFLLLQLERAGWLGA